MIKPAGKGSYGHFALGAGALLQNVDMADVAGAEDLRLIIEAAQETGAGYLGLTRGPTRFSAVPRHLRLGADGSAFVEGFTAESWDIKLEVGLAELTPDILALTLAASHDDAWDGKEALAPGEGREAGNLVWAGDLSDGRILVIELLNAVSAGGLRLELGPDEGLARAVFAPRQGSVYDDGARPFSVYYLGARGKGLGAREI